MASSCSTPVIWSPMARYPDGAMRFGAIAGDAQGRVTYKPWEVTQFLCKRLVPAKGSESDDVQRGSPGRLPGPCASRRGSSTAPPLRGRWPSLMGNEAFEPKQVEMARAEAELMVRGVAPDPQAASAWRCDHAAPVGRVHQIADGYRRELRRVTQPTSCPTSASEPSWQDPGRSEGARPRTPRQPEGPLREKRRIRAARAGADALPVNS